jgi:hypothetical protein
MNIAALTLYMFHVQFIELANLFEMLLDVVDRVNFEHVKSPYFYE